MEGMMEVLWRIEGGSNWKKVMEEGVKAAKKHWNSSREAIME